MDWELKKFTKYWKIINIIKGWPMLSEKQKNFYEKNGYLIVDNVISKDDLNLIHRAFDAILDAIINRAKSEHPKHQRILEDATNLSKKMNALEDVDHGYIAEFHDSLLASNNPYIAKLTSSTNILNHANFLLGEALENPLFTTSSMGIFSMPDDIEHTVAQWHTDIFYTCKDGHYVHFWAPIIEDSSEGLGAIHILPGSHNNPFKGEVRNKLSESNIHKYGVSSDFIQKYEDKVVQIKQGQGLFFDKHLVHRGGLNTTNRTRFGLVTLYHSMNRVNFTPYYLSHSKSTISSDDFFDEVMACKG
jgi:ectoine hydroxylase-related dioxygenase (phytanoyl-CoA dioxygenase family)